LRLSWQESDFLAISCKPVIARTKSDLLGLNFRYLFLALGHSVRSIMATKIRLSRPGRRLLRIENLETRATPAPISFAAFPPPAGMFSAAALASGNIQAVQSPQPAAMQLAIPEATPLAMQAAATQAVASTFAPVVAIPIPTPVVTPTVTTPVTTVVTPTTVTQTAFATPAVTLLQPFSSALRVTTTTDLAGQSQSTAQFQASVFQNSGGTQQAANAAFLSLFSQLLGVTTAATPAITSGTTQVTATATPTATTVFSQFDTFANTFTTTGNSGGSIGFTGGNLGGNVGFTGASMGGNIGFNF
jgi:hypothetical protein